MNLLLSFYFILFQASFLQAKPQVSASLDKTEVGLHDSVQLTITLSLGGQKEPENISIPDLSHLQDFDVLDTWSSVQKSYSFIQGKSETQHNIIKNYILKPRSLGRLRIDPISIQIDKQTHETTSLFVNVVNKVKKSQPRSRQAPISNPYFPVDMLDPFGKNTDAQLDILAEISHKQAYVGELIQARWYAVSQFPNLNLQAHKIPSFKGFWQEELDKNSTRSVKKIIKNQKTYYKILLDTYALVPLEKGEFTIEPYSVLVQNLFSFRSNRSIKSSPTYRLTVKALPEKGKLKNFTEAVGQFQVTAQMTKSKLQVNQPVSYKIKFIGKGQVQSIELPKIMFDSRFHSYSPVQKSQFSIEQSSKEFEFVLVPKQAGDYIIPGFTLSSFDPKKGKYVLHKLPQFSLKVQASNLAKTQSSLSFIETQGDKKNLLLESGNLLKTKFFIRENLLLGFWWLVYTLITLGFVFQIVSYLKNKNPKNLDDILASRIDKLYKLLKAGQQKELLISLINLIDFVTSTCSVDKSPRLFDKFFQDLQSIKQDLETRSFSRNSRVNMDLEHLRKLVKRVERLLKEMSWASSAKF